MGRKVVIALILVALVALTIFVLTRPKKPPTFAPIHGEEGSSPASLRLPLPDQPLWTGDKITGEYYGFDQKTFVAHYWKTRRLGEPEPVPGKEGVFLIKPFVLAAQPLLDEYDFTGAFDDIFYITRVVRILRDAKVFSAANPVVLVFPRNRSDPRTWESDDREPWIGIPVPEDTPLPSSLRAIRFPGGEVLSGEPAERTFGFSIYWEALVERAKNMGREPDFPIMYRYSGWQPNEGRIMVQPFLLLKKNKEGS